MHKNLIKQPAETIYSKELSALKKWDTFPKPKNWLLSPRAVRLFILGGKEADSPEISVKYIGASDLIELAITTLATQRGLLLMGVPGTGKTMLSELLSAAICKDSTLVIQGTSGTHEDQLLYGWNYAQLIANGPSENALVHGPVLRAMEKGSICRIEELTRMSSDVMDSLITVLSEKSLSVPELNTVRRAKAGFNIIATANDKDTGINDLSSALLRRFNIIKLELPQTIEAEMEIVKSKLELNDSSIKLQKIDLDLLKQIITTFKELREGKTIDGKKAIQSPSSVLSVAETINIMDEGLTMAQYFDDGKLKAQHLSKGILSAIIRDPDQDKTALMNYLDQVMKSKNEFKALYTELKKEVNKI